MIGGHCSAELIGTATDIVEQMVELADAGMDGTSISWVDFKAGLEQFQSDILPLMIEAGLRVAEPALSSQSQQHVATAEHAMG